MEECRNNRLRWGGIALLLANPTAAYPLPFPGRSNVLGVLNYDREHYGTMSRLITSSRLTTPDFNCPMICPHMTLLAPQNDAFDRLDGDLFDKLTTDDEYLPHLQALIGSHVIMGRAIEEAEIHDDEVLKTLRGTVTASFDEDSGALKIDGATVVDPDLDAFNGVVHGIDSVLIPPFLEKDIVGIAEDMGFSILVAAIQQAGLTSKLQDPNTPFTLFAPTDAAFREAGITMDVVRTLSPPELAREIEAHIIRGKIMKRNDLSDDSKMRSMDGDTMVDVSLCCFFDAFVTINGRARMIATNALASNGIIHTVNSLLVDPSLRRMEQTISGLVATNPHLSNLTDALASTGLDDLLDDDGGGRGGESDADGGGGPFTIFAPTDDAFRDYFRSLSTQDLMDLVTDRGGRLTSLLRYHIVRDDLYKSDLQTGVLSTMEEERYVTVQAVHRFFFSSVELNHESFIVDFDEEATNGVVHLIDRVLVPS